MKLAAVGFALVSSVLLHAVESSGDLPIDSSQATAVSFDLAAWCDVSGHRFVFEKTPLAEIIRTLGGGTIKRTGNAGAAVFDYYVDYTDGTRLIRFSSNNDMGGPEHALQGVEIRALKSSDDMERLPQLKMPIQFPFGSSDISFAVLTQKLGHAHPRNGVFTYIHTTTKKGFDSVGNKVESESDATLEFRVRRSKIVEMSVDRVTSS